MNYVSGDKGPADEAFWEWCFRHDMASHMRRSPLLSVRLKLHRSAHNWLRLCEWGVPARWASWWEWRSLTRYYRDRWPYVVRVSSRPVGICKTGKAKKKYTKGART